MIITPSAALANGTAQYWLQTLQTGASAASIEYYTGSKPASPGVAPNGTTQVLLGVCTCSTAPDVGSVTDNVLTFGAIAQDPEANDSGTATWARIKDGAGTPVFDVDVSDLAGNAFLKLNTTVIVKGGPISIASFVITF